MADDVQFTVNADATPPGGTLAATDETTAGPHTVGAHMGVAKLAVSADGDSTHIPATVADGLLVEVSNVGGIPVTVPEPLEVEGDAAHDAPVSGNPVAMGGRGSLLAPTPVSTDGDATWVRTDRRGNVGVVLVDENGDVIATTPTVDQGIPVEPVGGGSFSVDDNGGSLTVDGTVAVGPTVTPGTGATNLGKAEDAPFTTGDVGVMALGVRNDSTTTTAEDGDYAALQLNFDLLKTQAQIYYANAGGARTDFNDSAARALSVKNYQPTATRTQVADTASDTQLLAANTDRKKYSVYNDSTAVLYLASGSTAASTTNYTAQIPPNGFWEDVGFVGEVRGIWATDPGTGAARITEYE